MLVGHAGLEFVVGFQLSINVYGTLASTNIHFPFCATLGDPVRDVPECVTGLLSCRVTVNAVTAVN